MNRRKLCVASFAHFKRLEGDLIEIFKSHNLVLGYFALLLSPMGVMATKLSLKWGCAEKFTPMRDGESSQGSKTFRNRLLMCLGTRFWYARATKRNLENYFQKSFSSSFSLESLKISQNRYSSPLEGKVWKKEVSPDSPIKFFSDLFGRARISNSSGKWTEESFARLHLRISND